MVVVPFAPYPLPPGDPALDAVAEVLDPVLGPLDFGPASTGESGDHASVTFCRGDAYSTDDACVDLVIDLERAPDWHVIDVRYWGFPSERWHLPFAHDADLATQLAELARSLPGSLAAS